MIIEAMTQALEALYDSVSDNSEWIAKRENAVTSLRQAIEAAEKQEPVAWSYTNAQGRDVIIRGNVAPYEAPYEDATPLYTHPPKREWVGLTAKDLSEIPPSAFEGAIWADAKLKEKNGC